MSDAALIHGGDLAWATARFGTPKDDWLDLSTGINPVAYPMPELLPELWQRLPQTADLATLTDAAARTYGAANSDAIVAADGSQTLLQWLPRLLPPARTAIVAPTYGEYATCWQAAGHEIVFVPDIAAASDAQTIVLANPNNPDGRRIEPDALLSLADRCAVRGGWLIVDEAFADATPEISVAPQAGREGLVALRSFGKFFGLAGLRLGFALAPPGFAARLRSALGPWPVSGPAIAIGTRALTDHAWSGWTRDRLRRDGARLAVLLRQSGLDVIGGTMNFCLAAHDQAPALFDHLGRHGILVRAFAPQPTWLRFGLPAPERFARLDAVLADWSALSASSPSPASAP